MGNTCAHPHTQNRNKPNYYVEKEQPLPPRSLPGNRTAAPGNNLRQGNSTTPSKFQRLQIEEKHVAPSIVTVTGQGTITAPSKVQPLEIEEKHHSVSPTGNSDQSVQAGEKHVAQPSSTVTAIVTVTGQENITTTSKVQPLEIKEKHQVVPPTENSDQGVQTGEKHVAPPTITVTANLEEGNNVITVAMASQADEPPIPQSNEDNKTPAITAVIATQVEEPPIPRSNEEKKSPAITADIATQVEEPPILEGNEKNTSSGCRNVPDEDWEDWEEEDEGKDSVRISNERDECPTCLEGYDEENPKITTKCNHHYHLGCIFEWMERSATCPMCFKVMEFDETC
ncbi:hypothetical protein ACHQM5_015723 [Ranunculus cassubicifolius]